VLFTDFTSACVASTDLTNGSEENRNIENDTKTVKNLCTFTPFFFVFVPAVFPVLWEALGRRIALSSRRIMAVM
jgi:anthranilate phosphoribosyltransferase